MNPTDKKPGAAGSRKPAGTRAGGAAGKTNPRPGRLAARKPAPKGTSHPAARPASKAAGRRGAASGGAVKRLAGHYVVRHFVLAASLVIIFLFSVALLLGLFTRHNRYRAVPDFVGMTLPEAVAEAERERLRIEVNDSLYVPAYAGGTVLEQRPEAESKVKAGRRIFVTVNSFRQKMVPVPYVTGFSLRQAKNNLETAGLGIAELIYVDDMATNYILEQRIGGRAVSPQDSVRAEIGSGVTLVVGRNPQSGPVAVPKVVGLPLREAESRLWESGLNVGRRISDEGIDRLELANARVYAQSPEQTAAAPLGMPVEIRLTLDGAKADRGAIESDRAAAEMQRLRADSLTAAQRRADSLELLIPAQE